MNNISNHPFIMFLLCKIGIFKVMSSDYPSICLLYACASLPKDFYPCFIHDYFRHYDTIRDVRQNKGSILRASVEYIKLLKQDLVSS